MLLCIITIDYMIGVVFAMDRLTYEKIEAMARTPGALADTIEYVAQGVNKFVRRQERVLICFPKREPGSLASIMETAVRSVGGIPLLWGPDYRWKALLRQAFSTRATTIIGPPLIILGLSKLAKATGTPLFIHNVLTAGYPCQEWMTEGIQKGLDCRTWDCFSPGMGSVVGGFSCGKSMGIHLREDIYSVEILDTAGAPLPEHTIGEVVFYPNSDPTLRCRTMDKARLETAPCPCGCNSPRLMDVQPGLSADPTLVQIGAQLQTWTSVLDCKLRRGPFGLELEAVVFRGEKLPKLPSCAKQVVRIWDPARDMPFWWVPGAQKTDFNGESH